MNIDKLAARIATDYDIEDAAANDAVVAWAEQLDDGYEIESGELTDEAVGVLTSQAHDTWGPALAAPEQEAADARDELRSAQTLVDAHEGNLSRRDAAVRRALAAGIPVRDIVRETELTRSRVYQIRDGRR